MEPSGKVIVTVELAGALPETVITPLAETARLVSLSGVTGVFDDPPPPPHAANKLLINTIVINCFTPIPIPVNNSLEACFYV